MATANKVADATTEQEDTRAGGEGNETVPVVLQGEEPGACRTSSMLVASDSFEDLELCVGETNDRVNVSEASSEAEVFRDRVPSGPIDEITRLDGLALSNDVEPSTECSNGTPSAELTTEDSGSEQLVTKRVAPERTPSVEEEEPDYVYSAEWRAHRKHVFILSSAGKPIYSRYGDEDRIVTMVGLMQALVSVVQSRQDSLRCIIVGQHKFVFLVREHLILVGVVSSHESCQQMLLQLNYVYSQLLSVLTYSQLVRIFKHRRNYDLRRMLTGAEKFFSNLLDLMDCDPSFLLGAVRCLPLDTSVRDIVAQSIAQHAKVKDLVFAILIAEGQLITLVRMKKYFLHPHDLHLIFNLVGASESFKSAESWTPICLPRFDSSGYLHAHISYLDEQCRTCLLLLSVDRDVFFTLSDCKHKIEQRLRKYNCLKAISKAIDTEMTYTVSDTDITELRHFLYKSKSTAQFTCPEYEAPYSGAPERAHIVGLYQFMHQRLHSAARPLKILYYVGAKEALLGWTTNGFELYAVFGPLVTKNTAINSVNKLLKWIKKEEDRLFILNSPTF